MKAFKQCPSSKIVMSGYSQGGQIVHNAAKLIPAETMANVSSVVIFGDPCKSIISLRFSFGHSWLIVGQTRSTLSRGRRQTRC